MWLYWSLFLWPAMASVPRRRNYDGAIQRLALNGLAVTLVVVIGLRFQVGVDWYNYLAHLDIVRNLTWQESMVALEPAYGLLNWIAVRTGAGIWLVNLVCATIFVTGLTAFCRRTPNPWLALAVSMPLLTLVLAINYTRQSAAIGFVFLGINALNDGRIRRFVVLVVLGATFHSSAAVLIPLAIFSGSRNRLLVLLGILVASVVAYITFLSAKQEAFVQNYLGAGMASEGSGIRVAMNSVAAVMYLSNRKWFGLSAQEMKLWTWLSVVTLLFIPALLLSPSTTAVDRLALYFMPIQPFVFAHVSRFGKRWRLGVLPWLTIIAAYGAVLFVWFTFSRYAADWLPYRFYPVE